MLSIGGEGNCSLDLLIVNTTAVVVDLNLFNERYTLSTRSHLHNFFQSFKISSYLVN